MSFRDDRDALINRAEALERRTEQLQQELKAAAAARDDEAEQNVALQRKLKKLQRERDKLADKLGLRSTDPHSPDPKRRKIVLVLAALLLVVGSGIPLFFMADEDTPRVRPRAVPAPVQAAPVTAAPIQAAPIQASPVKPVPLEPARPAPAAPARQEPGLHDAGPHDDAGPRDDAGSRDRAP